MLAIIIVLTIFVSLILGVIIYNIYPDTSVRNILLSKNTKWVILFLQFIYLTMDILETHTGNILYGISASIFMIGFGVVIITEHILHYSNHGKFNLYGIAEGSLYAIVGIILLNLRYNEQKKEKRRKSKIHTKSSLYSKLRK